jgi:hypothetical protein
MGEWGQVTFFRTDDLDALERVISDLCLEEGLLAVPYVRRKRETWDKMQYGTGATSDRWAIALGAGRGGWSVVKTAPLELLAEPGGTGEHRLGIIARVLQCEALHMSLYDSTAMVIAQAAPTGEVVLSGYTLDGLIFHGVEIDEERIKPRIEGGLVPRSVHAALERFPSDGFDELLEQLADRRWAEVSLALIEGIEVPSARVLSFMRPALDKKPPLRVKLAVEEHPLGTRYVLDEGVWVDNNSLDAADAVVGAAFVRKVASWLEVPVTLGPGVPLSAFCVRAEPSEGPRPTGVETELLSIGSSEGAELLLHLDRGAGIAELEERSPHQRGRLVSVLARALTGARGSSQAAYRDFQRIVTEPTSCVLGAFAGERLVTAWRRRGTSAVAIEGREVFELPGLCSAIAGTPRRVALALVTPGRIGGQVRGYVQDEDVTRIVFIDVSTGEVQEVLRSDEHLTFAYTDLCFVGEVLGVRARRDREPVIVLFHDGTVEERPGDFAQWAREPLQSPILCDAEGLVPLACSASGARCLAQVGSRRLFVGRRA